MLPSKGLQKRIRLILDKLDQPDVDILASKLLSIRVIGQSWPGMPSMEILQQFSMNEGLPGEDVEKIDEILKRYE